MCASGPKICRYTHLKVRCQKLCTADLTWGPVLQHRSLTRLYIEVRGRQMQKKTNKQRNSSICSVYLSKRLALGFPIQQSLESLGAKILLLWYWKMQIIQCISLYVCCSDLADLDLLQDSYRIKSIQREFNLTVISVMCCIPQIEFLMKLILNKSWLSEVFCMGSDFLIYIIISKDLPKDFVPSQDVD